METMTKLIECKSVDVPKVETARRTFSKEFAVKLADSLKADGQLCPIVVRANTNNPSRYILVAGRHRLYGMKNVLKEQFISATIVELTENEASNASDVENLWRNPLNKAQTASALKRWHANWLLSLPAEVRKAADSAKPALGQADPSSGAVEAAAPVEAEAEFDKKVSAVTGQSLVSVRRSKSIAKAFTEDQLEVFAQMEVSQTDMLTIAKIKDAAKRGEVVALIAAGMTAQAAIDEVVKDEAPTRYNKAAKETSESKEASKAERAPELTDDEWFTANCGDKAAMLVDAAKFKTDALLFRSVSDLRHAFRSKGKTFLAAVKKVGVTGPFFNLVNRFVSISHPKDWLLCPDCKGQGMNSNAKCGRCFGGGYLLKTEEFL